MTDVAQNPDITHERGRTGLSADALRGASSTTCGTRSVARRPRSRPSTTTGRLALAVRDRMQDNRVASTQTSLDLGRKVTCYLSAEFLIGPQLGDNLLNLGHRGRGPHGAGTSSGLDLDELLGCEEEPGLGNGGLGRLAACYLDSLATLERPGDRLRHPLRVRHLRPGDPRRLAGREDRQLAAATATRGRSPSPTSAIPVNWGGHTEHVRRRRAAATASAGSRSASSRASPTTRRSRATA